MFTVPPFPNTPYLPDANAVSAALCNKRKRDRCCIRKGACYNGLWKNRKKSPDALCIRALSLRKRRAGLGNGVSNCRRACSISQVFGEAGETF